MPDGQGTIRVAVIEDDFRVAQVHITFVERVPGFEVVGIAHSAAEGRRMVAERKPELVLLDVYLPHESGLDLLNDIDVDTIMLTAAADPDSVRTAYARGAITYLVKPFTGEQLADRLTGYARYRRTLEVSEGPVSQDVIDRAVAQLRTGAGPPSPKGQSAVTRELVRDALRRSAHALSAAQIAAELGVARATAQRYLATLVSTGHVSMTLRYGRAGRPEHLYEWDDSA